MGCSRLGIFQIIKKIITVIICNICALNNLNYLFQKKNYIHSAHVMHLISPFIIVQLNYQSVIVIVVNDVIR